VRESLKVVSCLEQNFGLDVSDGLVCMWLYILECVIDFVKRMLESGLVIKMDVGIRSCQLKWMLESGLVNCSCRSNSS
jgi:hypothetical protein